MNKDVLRADLKQRGRASMDFLVNLSRGLKDVSQRAARDINEAVPNPETLPNDLDERDAVMNDLTRSSSALRTQSLVGDWHSREHGRIATEAFEELREEIEPDLRQFDEGRTTLTADLDFQAPDYWEGVNFHRTEGGWTGHPYQGFIHGEIIHRKMLDALFPGGIFKQRREIAAKAPRDHYDRILDMGCSSGHFTLALADAYPDAEIYGVDLSLQMLEHLRRVGNANGYAWKLYQRPAEATGFDDNYFDFVGSYILIHELPAVITRAVFKEAFRVLKPGGDMVMSDTTRFVDLDKVNEWRADRTARFGGEPYWREAARLDFAEVARSVGFEDVKAEGQYPHYVIGRKPA